MSVQIFLLTNTFSPGEIVHGKVVCHFNKDKRIGGIHLKIRGREHTSWSKSESYQRNGKTETRWVTYTGNNTFLALEQILADQRTIQSGMFEFPFDIILPRILPSTYISTNGYINYEVKAKVNFPSISFDYRDQKQINILPLIQLNTVNLSMNPIHIQDEKTICCCCCTGGSLKIDVYLDRNVFYVHEPIKLKVEVANMSNTSIEQMIVKIKNVIIEKVKCPRSDKQISSKTLTTLVESGVESQGKRTYEFIVQISCEINNFQLCQLFEQYFILKIEAVLPSPHINLKIEEPINFCHVLLNNSNLPVIPMAHSSPRTPWNVSQGPAPVHMYQPSAPQEKDLLWTPSERELPPSYDEAKNEKF